jgi:steroid delta-isomerase-like uncharacterized protein
MSTEENKAIARRHVEASDRGDHAAAFAVVAPDAVWHGFPGMPATVDAWKQAHAMFFGAFPDMRITIDDELAEGDKVVTRWTARGTHTGELMGIPPTGKRVTFSAIAVDRIAGGEILEHWIEIDRLGLMQQLGAIPAPGQAGR